MHKKFQKNLRVCGEQLLFFWLIWHGMTLKWRIAWRRWRCPWLTNLTCAWHHLLSIGFVASNRFSLSPHIDYTAEDGIIIGNQLAKHEAKPGRRHNRAAEGGHQSIIHVILINSLIWINVRHKSLLRLYVLYLGNTCFYWCVNKSINQSEKTLAKTQIQRYCRNPKVLWQNLQIFFLVLMQMKMTWSILWRRKKFPKQKQQKSIN